MTGYLEELWLFEAISETYIPLLSSFFKLIEEGIDFRITMSLTPPILSMLDNTLLKQRYIIYLKEKIKLSALEKERTKENNEINNLSKHYYDKYTNDLNFYLNFAKSDLISLFKLLQDLGYVELIKCGATHRIFSNIIFK